MRSSRRQVTLPLPPAGALTHAEAAVVLGVSERAIREHVRTGALRASWLGPRCVRIHASELSRLQEEQPARDRNRVARLDAGICVADAERREANAHSKREAYERFNTHRAALALGRGTATDQQIDLLFGEQQQ